MSNYRRAHAPGGTFFFTLVTYRRRPVLLEPEVRNALRAAVRDVRQRWPFMIDAWVLLPDHMHCLWTLPENDGNYSRRWWAIKRAVTRACAWNLGVSHNSRSRAARNEGTLWQRRFWEHQIRDAEDLQRHMDYIYWNPIKHGLVMQVADWPYSTFHRDVRLKRYPADWGGSGEAVAASAFGEPA